MKLNAWAHTRKRFKRVTFWDVSCHAFICSDEWHLNWIVYCCSGHREGTCSHIALNFIYNTPSRAYNANNNAAVSIKTGKFERKKNKWRKQCSLILCSICFSPSVEGLDLCAVLMLSYHFPKALEWTLKDKGVILEDAAFCSEVAPSVSSAQVSDRKSICQQLCDFIYTAEARRSTASEWDPWTAHILATEGTTRRGYTIKQAKKLSYPNSQAEVCFNLLNFAFEGKLEADFQLLYCLDDPDRVFKHICSAELWTGFFGEQELFRALRPIMRHRLSFQNSEKSCNVKKNWSWRSKEKGRQLADCFLWRGISASFPAFADKNKRQPYFEGLLGNHCKSQGHQFEACERLLLTLKPEFVGNICLLQWGKKLNILMNRDNAKTSKRGQHSLHRVSLESWD